MSDTQKSAIFLSSLIVAGVLCYIFILPAQVPERNLQLEVGEAELRDQVTTLLREFGYDASDLREELRSGMDRQLYESHIRTHGRSDLAERLDQESGAQPLFFYWQHQFSENKQDQEDDREEGTMSITIPGGSNIEVESGTDISSRYSLDGQLASMTFNIDLEAGNEEEEADIYTPEGVNSGLLEAVFAKHKESDSHFPSLSEIEQAEYARYDPDAEISEVIGNRLVLSPNDMLSIADAMVEKTYWQNFNMVRDSLETGELVGDEGLYRDASVVYSPEGPVEEYEYEVTLDFSAGGYLSGLEYDHELSDVAAKPLANLMLTYQSVVIGLILLGLIVLFLIRLNNQLLDIRLVLTDAFILVLIVIGLFISDAFAGSALLNTNELLIVSGGMLLLAFLAGVLYLPLAATTESLSHEGLPGKMDTLTLLRKGFIFNNRVAKSLAKGLSGGIVLFLISVFLFSINDRSFFDFSNIPEPVNIEILSGSYALFSSLYRGLGFSMIVLAPVAFFISYKTESKVVRIGVLFLVALVVSGLTPVTQHGLIDIAFRMVIAAMIVWILYRLDVLALMTAIFSGTLLVYSQNFTIGFFENSLAALLIFSAGILLVGLTYTGLYNRKDEDEIPDLMPEYLRKLAEQERIRQGHELAREVHQSFLPKEIPECGDLDMAARCKAAYDVGGDYYDFFRLSDQKMGVVIGDVSGKGIQAAFYMTLIKGYLQSLSDSRRSPARLISKINRLLRENAKTGTFITMIYGVIDLDRGSFTFVRAGHNPLLFLKKGEDKPEEYKPPGLAIGMATPAKFDKILKEETIDFNPGDGLVFFTDGYPESTNYYNHHLGDEAFYNLVASYKDESADSMIKNISEEVRKFSNNSHQFDDMTMVVIRRQ